MWRVHSPSSFSMHRDARHGTWLGSSWRTSTAWRAAEVCCIPPRSLSGRRMPLIQSAKSPPLALCAGRFGGCTLKTSNIRRAPSRQSFGKSSMRFSEMVGKARAGGSAPIDVSAGLVSGALCSFFLSLWFFFKSGFPASEKSDSGSVSFVSFPVCFAEVGKIGLWLGKPGSNHSISFLYWSTCSGVGKTM